VPRQQTTSVSTTITAKIKSFNDDYHLQILEHTLHSQFKVIDQIKHTFFSNSYPTPAKLE